MTTVRQWTGRESKALRQALRLSVRDFACSLGVAVRTVTRWEARGGQVMLRPDSQAMLDTALSRGDPEAQQRFTVILGGVAVPADDHTTPSVRPHIALASPPLGRSVVIRSPSHHAYQADLHGPESEDEDMHRRAFFQGVVLAGLAGVSAAAGTEALRHDLLTALDGPDSDLSDWEGITWEYGHSYATTTPRLLLVDLVRDLDVARGQFGRFRTDHERQALQRVIARLSVFLAETLENLGDSRASYRWWAVARRTADACGDADVRLWARGRELVRALYEPRPLPAVLDLADAAIGQSPRAGAGSVRVLAVRAQALALEGRTDEALTGIETTERAFEVLPASVTNDTDTMYGWPEYRLRCSQSFVYTYVDDATRAAEAQERALALHPGHMFRERAGVLLHQALGLVRSGDVAIGARHAQHVITDLPEAHRVGPVLQNARAVVQAVPHGEQHRPEARELRELVALPAGPASSR